MKILSKFNKKDLWTIPNILCYVRLALIPIFITMYIKAEEPSEYLQAALIVVISGLTDFLDGFIARNMNMITELGKLLDPLADKLTQAALIFVLVLKIRWMFLLLILFVVMQLFMLVAGLAMLKKGKKLDGAKWFGKISTTVFYVTMILLVAIPTLNTKITNTLMFTCGVFLFLSFVLYVREYVYMYREIREEEGISEVV
ncbi:MAG TPA: CDP-alcohol phosphatidyltransferase family protein [Clostridiales bacterium]|nr:CDP-alcohol phosphatidyltransferase family protein [Clostridiales bacterium]